VSSTPRAVPVLTFALLATGAATGALAQGPVGDWWLLPPLALALIVSETLQVEFAYGRDVRAVDVFEAVLAPVLVVFAGPLAVGLAILSKAISQHRLGIEGVKARFNVAQWAAAVGVASLLYRSLAGPEAGSSSTLPALVVALLGFAVANEIAMAAVLRAVNRVSLRKVVGDLAPQYPAHAVIWTVNAALGVLLAVSVAEVPATAYLLLAPLAFLRWSHQAFLSLRADRARLDGLARAAARLVDPIDPADVLPAFVDDVREAFESDAVELVLFDPPRVLRAGSPPVSDAQSLATAEALVARGGIRRVTAADDDGLVAAAVSAAGHHDALVAPLVRDGRTVGALVSYDRTGFVGYDEGEEAVIAALAAVATRAIEKSELLARAREVDRMKDDFISTVSHELRTPLTTIRGFTDLLDPSGPVSDEVRHQAVARIRKGTHRLERLVANLLEVSRIEARHPSRPAVAEVDLLEVVHRVVEEVHESWPERTIELDTGPGPWEVQGNLLSLERILINLLSNALTYAESGPVHLAVRAEGRDGVAVSVRDHGPGIAPADHDRIFERFERLDTADRKGGTGLGLYIVRGLAQSIGAELELQSEPGHGAQFTVHLRAAADTGHPKVIDLVR